MTNYAMVFNARDGLKKVSWDNDSLEFLQSSVDGYVDGLYVGDFGKGIALWINDEGKFRSDLEPSALLMYKGKVYDYVVGNIVFTGIDEEGETTSLTDTQIKCIKNAFKKFQYQLDFKHGLMLPLFNY